MTLCRLILPDSLKQQPPSGVQMMQQQKPVVGSGQQSGVIAHKISKISKVF